MGIAEQVILPEPEEGRKHPNSREAAPMFIIELIYTAPLASIDEAMPAHMKFLNKYYASGHFLVSGRKIPRDGGIIVAVGSSRDDVDAIAREDPFVARGLATFRVIEFRASQTAENVRERIAQDRRSSA